MNELRQQMIDAVLVPGFSPRTHKSCLAAMLKTIVIEGLSATELVRFWPVARIWGHAEKRPLEPMEVRRRSAMRDLSPKAAPGQELTFKQGCRPGCYHPEET